MRRPRALQDLRTSVRFALRLRRFLTETITPDSARATVRCRMQHREDAFVRLLEKGVFGHARSPYRALLAQAQVRLGDIQAMLRDRGLERTLVALREAGVYVTFEEFKGRQPIVRGGREITVEPRDFDNPYLHHAYHATSGGSTGAGTRVSTDLDHLAAEAPHYLLTDLAHGILGWPTATWLGVLPDSSGTNFALRHAHYGHVISKWFAYHTNGHPRPPLRFRAAAGYIRRVARGCGIHLPRPEPVSLEQAPVVARWLRKTLDVHGAAVLVTTVSRALRVSLAAQDAGLSLNGAAVIGTAEPATTAKVSGITQSGVRWIPAYAFVEAGIVGFGCARPQSPSDVHLFKDMLAVVPFPRRVPEAGMEVSAFNFTTLLPTAPKILINVEMDDYGALLTRSCGCPMEQDGLTDHLRDIYSFRKLTGEGVTLVGSDMLRVLEEALPSRFGGSALDYQLQEEEDERGFTRLSVVVSARLGPLDDARIVETVLDALTRGGYATDLARATWQAAGSLRVRRAEPVWTARGKLLPLNRTTIRRDA
jgi:hypothetical protein